MPSLFQVLSQDDFSYIIKKGRSAFASTFFVAFLSFFLLQYNDGNDDQSENSDRCNRIFYRNDNRDKKGINKNVEKMHNNTSVYIMII